MPNLDPKNKPFKKTFDFWLVFFIMPFQTENKTLAPPRKKSSLLIS